MAYIGVKSIKTSSHLECAIPYISNEKKSLNLNNLVDEINFEDEKKLDLTELKNHLNDLIDTCSSNNEHATYINCSPQNISKEFETSRKLFKQNKGVIAHHFYQSFDPQDNISPEKAHQIGVELAKKCFQNYQVVVSTHLDKNHIHNHFILNSVNLITGGKYHSHKTSLKKLRDESDKLCLKNDLSIIKNSSSKKIDRATSEFEEKNKSWKLKSWKLNLVTDLELAINSCKSQKEFIKFMQEKDYTVRYKDVHITITKNGEKKGIRVDTLAKQFGEKFNKINLEKAMGYYNPLSEIKKEEILNAYREKNKQREIKNNQLYKDEYKKLEVHFFTPKDECFKKISEKKYSRMNNYTRKLVEKNLPRMIKNRTVSTLYSNNLSVFAVRLFFLLLLISGKRNEELYQNFRSYKFHKKNLKFNLLDIKSGHKKSNVHVFGTMKYEHIVKSFGENFKVKVSAQKILLLAGKPLLYSALINNDGTAFITIKEKDKEKLAEYLEMPELLNKLESQSETIKNNQYYKKIKQEAEEKNLKLEFLVIDKKNLQLLQNNYVDFAYFPRDDGSYNISFLPEKKNHILKLVGKTKKPVDKNTTILNEIKAEALQSNEKLKYLIINAEKLTALKNTNIKFACFPNKTDKDKFNIAFIENQYEQVKQVLYNKKHVEKEENNLTR